MRDSNSRPEPCKGSILTAEIIALVSTVTNYLYLAKLNRMTTMLLHQIDIATGLLESRDVRPTLACNLRANYSLTPDIYSVVQREE